MTPSIVLSDRQVVDLADRTDPLLRPSVGLPPSSSTMRAVRHPRPEPKPATGFVPGDMHSFRHFYEADLPMVRWLARQATGDQAAAEEVAQDTFMALWQFPFRFDENRSTIGHFLWTIVHRRSIDWRRSRIGRQWEPLPETAHPSGDTTTEDAICHDDARRVVRRALAGLPEELRAPIELAYFGGLTYRQVAVALGEPEGTVKGRIRLGLKKLALSGEPDLSGLLSLA